MEPKVAQWEPNGSQICVAGAGVVVVFVLIAVVQMLVAVCVVMCMVFRCGRGVCGAL